MIQQTPQEANKEHFLIIKEHKLTDYLAQIA
jgi:hypothetical protein